jgi:hypothetical protein
MKGVLREIDNKDDVRADLFVLKISIDENCQTHLPELCTNLVTTLSSLNVNDFPHCIDEFDERLNARNERSVLGCFAFAMHCFDFLRVSSALIILNFLLFRGILDFSRNFGFSVFSCEMREDRR